MSGKRSGRRKAMTFVATLATLIAVTLATPAIASADESSGNTIVYSPTYLRYVALFPAGYAPNACELAVALSGEDGVCTAEFAPVWFYPDGTLGERPWRVDPGSPTGWSIDPDPCAEAFAGTDPDTDWWPLYIAYLDWVLGWTETPPEGITELQGDCLIQIYGF